MAVADALLKIKILADVKDATAGLAQTEQATSKWGSGLNKAAGVAAVGLAAVGGIMISGAKAAAEDAQGQAILAQALKNSAGATKGQVAATEEWISKQTAATGIADDQLRPALANLVRATGDVATSQSAMGLAMDISTATGKDLESVSLAMAKAYGGNTTALGKMVPGIDAAVLKSKDMEAISAELAKTVGGSTAAAADTAAGQYKIFESQIAETKEGIGAALLPVLTKLTGIMTDVSKWAANNTGTLTVLLGAFAALSAIIITVNAVTKAWVAMQAISKAATATWTAVQWLLNAALTANPIGLVIVAVAAFIAIIIIAWKRSDTFRAVVTAAFQGVLAAAKSVWSWISSAWDSIYGWLTAPFKQAVSVISGVFSRINDIILSAWGRIQDIFDRIASAVHRVTSLIRSIPKPSIPDLNPFTATATGVAGAAPTGRAYAGVARAPAARSSSSGHVTVNFNGLVTDPDAVARELRRILDRADVRGGRRQPFTRAWSTP